MTDNRNAAEHIASVESSIGHLRQQLVTSIPPFERRPGEKLVRLAAIWREAQLYRMVDLGSASLAMFQEGRLVPGCTLTRSLYETVAQLHYFKLKLTDFIDNPNIPEIADFAIRMSWGSKERSSHPDPIQILTALKHLNKEFPGSQDEYFHLCEYAHPNFKGALGTYARIERTSLEVAFGINPQNLPMVAFGLGGLDNILTIAGHLYDAYMSVEANFRTMVYKNASDKYLD
jgi:hypothetical protein